LLWDLGRNKAELDTRTVLVVDETAMVGTRKLAPLLEHAARAGSKVVLVGDDRQFASIDAGGGFRALRLRLGASELTVNRRQVQEWEQRAIEDVRAGRVEEAICAYAEHDRVQAFDARDDRDRAVLNDWWQAHQAGEEPVIYAHRRAQVDRLNQTCQRLRAQAGQLGVERLAVGDLQVAVGDRVVLGANALERLGVVNGTSAEITGLDVPGRALMVRTLDDEQPRTVTVPSWYLDGEVRPGQSRRVDLAYARTDMRSQGRTEQRALLALDGKEDMQGFYVQVSRSIERTDLYLTAGPEPLGFYLIDPWVGTLGIVPLASNHLSRYAPSSVIRAAAGPDEVQRQPTGARCSGVDPSTRYGGSEGCCRDYTLTATQKPSVLPASVGRSCWAWLLRRTSRMVSGYR
jgi:ATP-dependent exoDNAse (exonuclease V) alpha subunit